MSGSRQGLAGSLRQASPPSWPTRHSAVGCGPVGPPARWGVPRARPGPPALVPTGPHMDVGRAQGTPPRPVAYLWLPAAPRPGCCHAVHTQSVQPQPGLGTLRTAGRSANIWKARPSPAHGRSRLTQPVCQEVHRPPCVDPWGGRVLALGLAAQLRFHRMPGQGAGGPHPWGRTPLLVGACASIFFLRFQSCLHVAPGTCLCGMTSSFLQTQ